MNKTINLSKALNSLFFIFKYLCILKDYISGSLGKNFNFFCIERDDVKISIFTSIRIRGSIPQIDKGTPINPHDVRNYIFIIIFIIIFKILFMEYNCFTTK